MFYPVMIEMKGRLVCIVGGGKVALRKARKLLEYGSRIRVISPSINKGFGELEDKITIVRDIYRSEYLKDAFLVVASTSDKEINKEISRFCREKGVMCNVVDDIDTSDFIVPSTVRRGDLVISISTSGRSPVLSKKIRAEIENNYGIEYEEKVKLLGEIRELVLKNINDESERETIFNKIVNFDLEKLQRWKEDFESSLK